MDSTADTTEAAESVLQTIGLVSVELKVSPTERFKETELYYIFSITRPQRGPGDHFYFMCELECGRKLPDEEDPATAVEVRYGCFLKRSVETEEAALQSALNVSRYAIWAKFSDLFMLVTSQMGIDFPPLPADPGKINITDVDDTSDSQDD